MTVVRSGVTPTPIRLILLLCTLLPRLVECAFINFDNCLDRRIIHTNPLSLQFIPLFFDARFNTSHPSHNLQVTVYGNVSGQQFDGPYPPADSPQWQDPSNPFGKIANVTDNYSTLFADFKVVTFDAYDAPPSQFCKSVVNGTCPVGPAFGKNASNPYELPAFSIAHDMYSPYNFATFQSTLRVVSGDIGAPNVACVSASITPYLGDRITGLLTWLPAAVLILKGIATLSAAIWSPWGTTDIFRWSSNYGRDEDLLRLVTPGFGDCLQYIQFVTLTGALSLQYPGFFQPAVSQTAWSILMFNQSFVSHGPGTQSLVDGIYVYNSTYGMAAMSQLVGMTETKDIWACMAIFLLVIAAAVVVLTQVGFFGRWIYRKVTDTSEEDLRAKNLPFTLGNLIRLAFNFFILPIVAISLFQLVITDRSPAVVVAMAAISLTLMIIAGVWILRVIFAAKPRTFLFDDMPTLLLYGPLYNTYSDSAAPFALVPVFITFMRGVAFGSIQPSGIAQIIVLAICEVVLILTLNGFRPFQGQTSMNAYHTSFAIVRLITILLAVAFVPSLGVTEAPKGWIGYVILFLHALVLLVGFFLNSAQTLLEVLARAFGAGGDPQHGAIRGSILGMRMLKKRRDRPALVQRQSGASNAAMLQHSDGDTRTGVRSRSISASSHQLLGRRGPQPSLSGFENFSSAGDRAPTSPGADLESPVLGYLPLQNYERQTSMSTRRESEGYYRAPRPRKATLDTTLNGGSSRNPGEFPYQDAPEPGHLRHSALEQGFAPGFFRERADSNEMVQRPDYAVREVDQYYRGTALSDQPTRKLKTGPADPEGPAASAQSWMQRLLASVMTNKTKEPTKGFEVVRSSRMPKEMQGEVEGAVEMETGPHRGHEPYRDLPTVHGHPTGELVESSDVGPLRQTHSSTSSQARAANATADVDGSSDDRASRPIDLIESLEQNGGASVQSQAVPTLDPIDPVGRIDLPSRFNSRRSQFTEHLGAQQSSPGSDWLRDVDELTWNHGNVSGSSQTGVLARTDVSDDEDTPNVPPRSSRRVSQIPTGAYEEMFANFSTNLPSSNARSLSSRVREQDGESLRQGTHHRRAADSITRNSLGTNAALHGATAEVFDDSTPGDDLRPSSRSPSRS